MYKKIAETKSMEVFAEQLNKYGEQKRKGVVASQPKYLGGAESNFVLALVERWGMVAGKPDGEDSAGRSKLGLLSEGEVVQRAIKTAELTFAAMRENGMLIPIPSQAEVDEIVKEMEDSNA